MLKCSTIASNLMGDPQKTVFPTVAGILMIVSGCLFIANDLIIIPKPSVQNFSLLIMVLSQRVVPILAGVLALAGGIMCLRRTNLIMATIGAVFILPLSLQAWPNYLSYEVLMSGSLPNFVYVNLLVSSITSVFSLLSLIFIAVSRSEFS